MPTNLACTFLGPNVTSTAQGTNHNVFRAPVTPLSLLIFLTPCGMNKVLLISIELDHFNTQVTKSQVEIWLAVLDKTVNRKCNQDKTVKNTHISIFTFHLILTFPLFSAQIQSIPGITCVPCNICSCTEIMCNSTCAHFLTHNPYK